MTATLTWRPTNAPFARRYDDIWFIDAQVGWGVNSNGHILQTTNGGQSWTRQHAVAGAHLRCVGFADAQTGWVGTLTPLRRLFHTSNGGANWAQVTNLPANAPSRICGLSIVNAQVVYAAGTNFPTDAPRMMKTTDGGLSWTAWEMRPHASILIDTLFLDELRGWVVGGKADDPDPQTRDEIKPVVLFTADGGKTWVNRLAGQESSFPFAEWGWKIQFIDKYVGFVSLENLVAAAILKTTDGGLTWARLPVNDPQGNANLEGIGFIDEQRGWVGGWGDQQFLSGRSSGTDDGGLNWRDANEIGLFINRFRFLGNPVTVGYASGDTVYKYTADPVPDAAIAAQPAPMLLPQSRIDARALPAEVPLIVPAGTVRLSLDMWNRFGRHVGCLLDEIRPAAGARTFLWDGRDSAGQLCGEGIYILRATADAEAESAFVVLQSRRAGKASQLRWIRHRLRLPAVSPLRALALTSASTETVVEIDLPDLSGFATPLDKARFLLETAAEVEHALLVQYLYAGYSLKKATDVSDAQQKAALREWKSRLIGIAKEEMGHLMTVQNLLRLLGQSVNFEREDMPAPQGLYPFKMQLEPLTQSALAKYVVAESPIDVNNIDDIVQQATESAGTTPNHVGALYALLGVVFTRPGDLVANAASGDSWYALNRDTGALALLQEPGLQGWHLPDNAFDPTSLPSQATDAEWSPGAEIRVFAAADRQAALNALRDISQQGEGPVQSTSDPLGSHFQRFLAVYRGSDTAQAFPAAGGAWRPARDVPTNPRLDGPPGDPNAISEVKAADFARLSDLRYALLFGYLEQCYLVVPGLRRMLVGWCFQEMRMLQTLSDVLTGLPRALGQTGVAALPLTLPTVLHLPAQLADQWQVHIDRLNAALALAQQMLNTHSGGNQMLVSLRQEDQMKLQQAQQVQQGTLPVPALGRLEEVRRILDAAMGFGGAPHGRFWNLPLAQFVAFVYDGLEVIAPPGPNRGQNSNLIKALKGEDPFDGSVQRRMPPGRPAVAPNHIAFIEAWIDADCPEI